MPQLPSRTDRFRVVEMQNETQRYDTSSHNVVYLDATSSVVWALCDGTRDVEQIVELVAAAYPEQRERVVSDVRNTIAQLTDGGAVVLTVAG